MGVSILRTIFTQKYGVSEGDASRMVEVANRLRDTIILPSLFPVKRGPDPNQHPLFRVSVSPALITRHVDDLLHRMKERACDGNFEAIRTIEILAEHGFGFGLRAIGSMATIFPRSQRAIDTLIALSSRYPSETLYYLGLLASDGHSSALESIISQASGGSLEALLEVKSLACYATLQGRCLNALREIGAGNHGVPAKVFLKMLAGKERIEGAVQCLWELAETSCDIVAFGLLMSLATQGDVKARAAVMSLAPKYSFYRELVSSSDDSLEDAVAKFIGRLASPQENLSDAFWLLSPCLVHQRDIAISIIDSHSLDDLAGRAREESDALSVLVELAKVGSQKAWRQLERLAETSIKHFEILIELSWRGFSEAKKILRHFNEQPLISALTNEVDRDRVIQTLSSHRHKRICMTRLDSRREREGLPSLVGEERLEMEKQLEYEGLSLGTLLERLQSGDASARNEILKYLMDMPKAFKWDMLFLRILGQEDCFHLGLEVSSDEAVQSEIIQEMWLDLLRAGYELPRKTLLRMKTLTEQSGSTMRKIVWQLASQGNVQAKIILRKK